MMIRPGIKRLFHLALWRRHDAAPRVDDEIRTHLDMRTQELIRQGWNADHAADEALRRFGPLADARREMLQAATHREQSMRFRESIESLVQDVRYALRGLRREPTFTAFVIGTLALGMGANAAMFSVADRLLLRGPQYVQHPSQLSRLYMKVQPRGMKEVQTGTFGYAMYAAMRNNATSFAGVSGYTINSKSITLGHGASARLLTLGESTADLFPLLGVTALRGRFFTEAEDNTNAPEHVVTIGYGIWQREFGGSDDVIGKTITLGDEPYRIVGVAPKGFTGPELAAVDVWMPLSIRMQTVVKDWTHSWNWQALAVVARVKPGVTVTYAAGDAMLAYHHAYTGTDTSEAAATLGLAPIGYSRDGVEPAEAIVSRWLLGVAVIVLLIACSNVINLLLARAVRRRREVAVRLALGAGRARLFRLRLIEGLLLAGGGGLAGLVVALVTGGVVRSVLLPDVEWPSSTVDARVIAFSALVSLFVGVVVTLVPAIRPSTLDLTAALKSGVRDGGGRRVNLRATLTVAQAALSVVLLVGAGLFVMSLHRVRTIDLGIQPDRVLVVDISWQRASTLSDRADRAAEELRRVNFFPIALDRVRALAGVERASLTVGLPFGNEFRQGMRVQGMDSMPKLNGRGPTVSAVGADYFETVGTRVRQGRSFSSSDRAESEPVAIVSAAMAATAWPGQDPLGKCIYSGENHTFDKTQCARVVGVAADANQSALREPAMMHYYLPFGQETGIGGTDLLVRPRGNATVVAEQIRRELTQLDPSITLVETALMQETIDSQSRSWTLGASMFSLMGVLALIVAAMGLYSVMSYLIAQRTHEIGVRLALGAQSRDIVGLVVFSSLGMATLGVALGLGFSLAAGKFLEPLLFDTSPRSPIVLAGVAVVLIGVALLASVVPAIRAKRVDPMLALRTE